MNDDETSVPPGHQEPARRRGRPPGRSSLRDQFVDDTPHGPMTVLGRDGKPLSRKRKDDGSDQFYVPPEIIPKGWSYQWCTETVVGNKDLVVDDTLRMYENGWRPVPSDRHEGRFMPAGYKGNIVRGGQILMERPQALTDEANAERVAKAKAQVTDSNERFKGVRGQMRDGFEMNAKYKGTGGDIRMSIDRGLDIPAPNYQPPED